MAGPNITCVECGNVAAAGTEDCPKCGQRLEWRARPTRMPEPAFDASTGAWKSDAPKWGWEHAGPVVLRSYRAKNPAEAAAQMAGDATAAAANGYFVTSQSWAQGSWGCGAYLVGVLAILLLGFGLLILGFLVIVKPAVTLTVTYQRQAAPARPCPTCGATPAPGMTFCGSCGAKLA